eukprot:scaffold5833_cov165-Amphora_coffeaeformis.AAC.27
MSSYDTRVKERQIQTGFVGEIWFDGGRGVDSSTYLTSYRAVQFWLVSVSRSSFSRGDGCIKHHRILLPVVFQRSYGLVPGTFMTCSCVADEVNRRLGLECRSTRGSAAGRTPPCPRAR